VVGVQANRVWLRVKTGVREGKSVRKCVKDVLHDLHAVIARILVCRASASNALVMIGSSILASNAAYAFSISGTVLRRVNTRIVPWLAYTRTKGPGTAS
jgi:hypothetical protein